MKNADIIVNGIDKVKVNLAHCCYPVYGDDIIGYITRGSGISVHRINCHNLDNLEDRIVDVKWNSNVNKKYLSYLVVYSSSNDNNMLELLKDLSYINVSVEEAKILDKDDNFVYEISIYVDGIDQLNKIITTLNNKKYIDNVERTFK